MGVDEEAHQPLFLFNLLPITKNPVTGCVRIGGHQEVSESVNHLRKGDLPIMVLIQLFKTHFRIFHVYVIDFEHVIILLFGNDVILILIKKCKNISGRTENILLRRLPFPCL